MSRVINPFIFGGGGGGSVYPAVNGKSPVAAWCPSRDTSGNGTTTLTDLVGSSSGTLTNMDAVTDWPADVTAGGVRALDFDGVNDQVVIADAFDFSSSGAISLWFEARDAAASSIIFLSRSSSVNRISVSLLFGHIYAGWYDGTGYGVRATSATGWHHLVAWHSGGGVMAGYLDGAAMDGVASAGIVSGSQDKTVISGRTNSATSEPFDGRVDDVRVFNTVLTASDAAALWDSGNGRGGF